jgi:hypothetical protein
MKKITTPLAAGLLSVALIGCGAATPGTTGSGGSSTGTGGGSGTGGSSGSCSANITATEANDYKFSSTLSLAPVSIKPKTELSFDWGDLTQDFIHHHLDAKKDVDQILMFLWKLNQTDLQKKLNDDDLRGTDLVGGVPLTFTTDHSTTHANLFTFKIGTGEDVKQEEVLARLDPATYAPDKYTYTLMAATGMDLGMGVRMIQAFKLDSSSDNTSVKLDDHSTGLEYSANLHDLQSPLVPSGQGNLKIDWSNIPKNALGIEFDPTSITEAMVGHYTEKPSELEGDKFLDLDMIATDLYKGEIASGTSVDLSTLKSSSNKSFSGIDSSGTWIVALRCGQCRNPAPWYLTVLKPCP